MQDETAALVARDAQAFLGQDLSSPCRASVRRAEGIWVEDHSGRRFMDFHGNSAHHLGHAHPRVLAAIRDQLDGLIFAPRHCACEPATTRAALEVLDVIAEESLVDRVEARGRRSGSTTCLKRCRRCACDDEVRPGAAPRAGFQAAAVRGACSSDLTWTRLAMRIGPCASPTVIATPNRAKAVTKPLIGAEELEEAAKVRLLRAGRPDGAGAGRQPHRAVWATATLRVGLCFPQSHGLKRVDQPCRGQRALDCGPIPSALGHQSTDQKTKSHRPSGRRPHLVRHGATAGPGMGTTSRPVRRAAVHCFRTSMPRHLGGC